ncbi:hypothetical protein FS837_010603 [Tulasnella sp. UAMH 9824]|nr:hypothetical protein FS837_010603 [Tulasnella sp. UAMH 9824]
MDTTLPDRVSGILTEFCFKISVNPTRRIIAPDPPQVSNNISSQTSPPGVVTGDVSPATNASNAAPKSGSFKVMEVQTERTVFRRADRTPKQNLKYSFPVSGPWTRPFIKLLNGVTEEIFLSEREHLNLIGDAIEEAEHVITIRGSVQHAELNEPFVGTEPQEDLAKLAQLNATVEKKIDLRDTKPLVFRGVS